MKWFKHYENASTNRLLQALLSERNGVELYGMYFLLLELLCGEFKKDTTEFILSETQIKSALRVNYVNKLHGFLTKLAAFSHQFDRELLKVSRIEKNFYKIETPIILELMGKGFKRRRQESVSDTSKKEEKRKKKEEIRNKTEPSKNSAAYIEIINHLNLKTGKNYKSNSKTTRSKIDARISESFSLKDFEKVIDNKTNEWKGGEFEKFLRPETLFGNKFEGYLNENNNHKELTDAEMMEFLDG